MDMLNGFNRDIRTLAREGEEERLPELQRDMSVTQPNSTLPDEVNWVEAGAVTDVKDQGKCASCYVFSVVGALEGQMFLKKKQKLESLSAQNILDCSRSEGNQGCLGGRPELSFDYVMENKGINTEADYRYEGKEGECRFRRKNVRATGMGYRAITPNEWFLQEAVATAGPVPIVIDSRHLSFLMYKSGVYSEPNCNPYATVHAVLAVGYGVDPKTKKDYWLVKNSWGSKWGNQGYIKIARNAQNMCGVATMALYPKVSE